MESFLRSDLWPHNWTQDRRDPVVVLELWGEQYGIYNISILYWIELLTVSLLVPMYIY